MLKEIEQRKVGALVAENFKTAKVFTKYGIDFCCKGGITLQEACSKHGVNLQDITEELNKAAILPDSVPYIEFGLSQLTDYIIVTHHKYVENTIPILKGYLQKLATVHGERHPELFQIRDEFIATSDALTTHMKKEEFILFPYIKAMEEAEISNFPLSKPHFGHIDNPIQMMEEEHDTEGERFRTISKLSDEYKVPSDGCQTYRIAFAMLKEFESDLHTHIHLENNILFPKSKILFKKLNS